MALTKLTESVAKIGSAPGKANDSALIRVRTNESPTASSWQLREFTIQSGLLRSATIKQTPAERFANDSRLAKWINANAQAIKDRKHRVPTALSDGTPFLGAQTTRLRSLGSWKAPGTKDPEVRHLFSLETCNGCHGVEAPTLSLFAHVEPRYSTRASQLSGLLTGEDRVDPENSSVVHHFNRLHDRNQDMADYLAGNILHSLAFQPKTSTH